MKFQNKVVLITGSASGIGFSAAQYFAKEGASVILVDISAKLEAAERDLRSRGHNKVLVVRCDVSKEGEVIAAVDKAIATFGRLDVIVNNAGLMTFKRIIDQVTDDWLRILSVDLLGAFYFTKQALLKMEHGGSVINISSIHAIETTALVAPYAAAKTALLSLTRSAGLEGKERGIRFNAILPGAIDTPMLRDNPNIVTGVEKIDPADTGKPEDVVGAIAFLASAESNFVQGAMIRVDGGRLDRL
ncbi:MAG TPA: SDR family NAD(P)-dependent oxidoreductase [Cyclobacteriaceae bacterium]|nr:SDR family NAD(P)-dependent oxidoreductase [Cyclobacteriaceae bacterium]